MDPEFENLPANQKNTTGFTVVEVFPRGCRLVYQLLVQRIFAQMRPMRE